MKISDVDLSSVQPSRQSREGSERGEKETEKSGEKNAIK
jgi:hypothetical protein